MDENWRWQVVTKWDAEKGKYIPVGGFDPHVALGKIGWVVFEGPWENFNLYGEDLWIVKKGVSVLCEWEKSSKGDLKETWIELPEDEVEVWLENDDRFSMAGFLFGIGE